MIVFFTVALVVLLLVGGIALADPGHEGDIGEWGGFPGESLGEPGPLPPASPRASSKNIRVLGHADPGGGFNGDVVAHGGFAYLGSWGAFEDENVDFCPSQGVRVYSLHNPSNPTLVATFADEDSEPDLQGTWTEKVIVRHVNTRWFNGDLAAVSIQSCAVGAFAGFGVWDVTNPANPQRLSLYSAAGTGGSHEIWLEASENRAHVYTAIPFSEFDTSPDGGVTPGRADFRIVDVSNPTSPTDVGEWGAWAELGLFPFSVDANDVFRVNFVHSVIGAGNRVYLSYWDLGTVILDVSDPANPTFIGHTSYAANEEGNAHSAWLGTGGYLLIQTDEDFDPSPNPVLETSWGYARFFDISDPAIPAQVSTFKLPTTTQFPPPLGFFSVHDPKVRGGLAYFSWYSEGVLVVDISLPANPRIVAQFVPPPAEDPRGFFAPPGVAFPFVWGTFVERNYVLASDINSGLWVFQVR
jgi:hypothetical protein